MKEYGRDYPLYSLCGLNCGLCPRYQTDGESKCPGCGGKDFHLKHPSCAVITCSREHGNPQYCFQCASYPCPRYHKTSEQDSFITYRNVITDFQKAKDIGLEQYKLWINEKVKVLEYLLENYNDGRKKNFYCLAVNLLPFEDVKVVMDEINTKISKQDSEKKDKIKQIVSLFEEKAKELNIELKLRK